MNTIKKYSTTIKLALLFQPEKEHMNKLRDYQVDRKTWYFYSEYSQHIDNCKLLDLFVWFIGHVKYAGQYKAHVYCREHTLDCTELAGPRPHVFVLPGIVLQCYYADVPNQAIAGFGAR